MTRRRRPGAPRPIPGRSASNAWLAVALIAWALIALTLFYRFGAHR